MKQWSVYDTNTGKILSLLTDPFFPVLDMGAEEDGIEGHYDQLTMYIDTVTQEAKVRPTMPLSNISLSIAVGETLRIDDIPANTSVIYPGADGSPQTEIVDDNYIEWSSMEPGDYRFEFSNFPYIEEVIIATVSDV